MKSQNAEIEGCIKQNMTCDFLSNLKCKLKHLTTSTFQKLLDEVSSLGLDIYFSSQL